MPKLITKASARFILFLNKSEVFTARSTYVFTVNDYDNGNCVIVYPFDSHFVTMPSFHSASTEYPPRARSPLKLPLLHCSGRAGRSLISVVALE